MVETEVSVSVAAAGHGVVEVVGEVLVVVQEGGEPEVRYLVHKLARAGAP